jgi:ATP-dependent Zn protease
LKKYFWDLSEKPYFIKKEKEIAAYHEAGHALVSSFHSRNRTRTKNFYYFPRHGWRLHPASSIEENKMKTKNQFLAEIATLLGGWLLNA